MSRGKIIMTRIKTRLLFGLSVLFILSFLVESWYTVDSGERAIQLRNGAVIKTSDAGLHFKVPFIDSVRYISTRTQTYSVEKDAYSSDLQSADTKVSVTFRVPADKVEAVYNQFGNIENLTNSTIAQILPNQIENTFGKYNSSDAIDKRSKLTSDTENAIRAALAQYPIQVLSVQLKNVKFTDDFEKSVEAQARAVIDVKTQGQILAKEKVTKQIIITQAEAKAESALAQARAEAKATILRGDAEAKAIIAKTKALENNPSVVELTKAERWDGKLPTTMLPNSAVPFIEANKE